MPKIAIVVLFYKDPQDVEDCLGSLTQIDYPESDFDIIAIDNNSQNVELTQKLRKYSGEVVLIENDKNIGYAGGNNLGIDYALKNDFDYVYILNPDTQVNPDFLRRAVELAESDVEIAIAQSKILLHSNKTKIQTSGNKIHYTGIGFSGDFNKADDIGNDPFEIAYGSGAGMLIRADFLRQIGGFNERYFMYHEDLDMGWLAHLYGRKVYTEPKSVIYHKYEFSKNKGKYFWMERNRWWTLVKNYKLATLGVLFPALLALELMLFVYAALNGWLFTKIRSCFAFWGGLPKILKERKIVQQNRKVSDREFLKYVETELEFSGMTEGVMVKIANLFFWVYFKIFSKIVWW